MGPMFCLEIIEEKNIGTNTCFLLAFIQHKNVIWLPKDVMMTHVGCFCFFLNWFFSNGNIFPMDMNFLPLRASLDGHSCSCRWHGFPACSKGTGLRLQRDVVAWTGRMDEFPHIQRTNGIRIFAISCLQIFSLILYWLMWVNMPYIWLEDYRGHVSFRGC